LNNSYQEVWRKVRTRNFYPGSSFHMGYVQSFAKPTKIFTKMIQDQFTPLLPASYTLLPAVLTTPAVNPRHWTLQLVLHQYRNPLHCPITLQ